jgi:hypothetical protein
MDEIKKRFIKNLQTQEKLMKKLKQQNFNAALLDSRDLIFAYKKIREHLDRHLANVVLFCKKRMVRDVITFAMDLSKIEQRLKELQQAVSLVNLVGQYLPPLPKVDIDALISQHHLQPDGQRRVSGEMQNIDASAIKVSSDFNEDQIFELDSENLLEQSLFWSEEEDMKEMDIILHLFKDSPQDQLLLMKIRFE